MAWKDAHRRPRRAFRRPWCVSGVGTPAGWNLISSLPRLQLPSQFTGFAQGYIGPQQRKLYRRLILGPAKGIYVGGTLISILISLYLFVSGRRESGIFVGLWAPTVLNLGQTLFEDDES
jgi:hypothetical protein